jgi:hypothetical protein
MHHVKDEMLKPNLKTVFGGPIPKMEGLNKCRVGRCSPSECHLSITNPVFDLRQAPEHSKPPILQKQLSIYMLYMYCCIKL